MLQRRTGIRTLLTSCCLILVLAGCRGGQGDQAGYGIPDLATRASRQFAYTTGVISPGRVFEFSITNTGTLSSLPGSPYREGGMEPYSIAATPSGKFLYVVNCGDENISAYAVNSYDGSLTVVPGSPFRPPVRAGNPMYAAVHPSGKYLYLTNSFSPGAVTAYSIDPQSGALRLVPGIPFEGVNTPNALAFDPQGKFLFVSNRGYAPGASGNVSVFRIDPENGAISPVPGSPFAAGQSADGIAVDASGKFLYTSDPYGGNILGFTINPASGALTPMAGSPFAAGSNPATLAVHPAGILYVAHQTVAGGVSAFKIDPTSGQLTAVAGSPFHTHGTPVASRPESSNMMAFDAAGKYLYVPVQHAGIDAFKVAADGVLSPVPGSPFPAGEGTNGIAVAAVQ